MKVTSFSIFKYSIFTENKFSIFTEELNKILHVYAEHNGKNSSHDAYIKLLDLGKKVRHRLFEFDSVKGSKPGVKIGPVSVLDVNNVLSYISSKEEFVQQLSNQKPQFYDSPHYRAIFPNGYVYNSPEERPELIPLSEIEACDIKEDLTKQLRIIRRLLTEFRKKIIVYYVIDLRQSFRTKIKFLFKNMDDCSDNNNVLVFKKTISLLIRTNFRNEKNRDYKIFTRFA